MGPRPALADQGPAPRRPRAAPRTAHQRVRRTRRCTLPRQDQWRVRLSGKPLPKEEIWEMPPSDLIDYCINEPFETAGWEERESGTGGLAEVSPRGLAEAATPRILEEVTAFKNDIPGYKTLLQYTSANSSADYGSRSTMTPTPSHSTSPGHRSLTSARSSPRTPRNGPSRPA